MDRRTFLAGTAATASLSAAEQDTGPKRKTVRITVLKTSLQNEFQQYAGRQVKPCDAVKEGQQFTLASPWTKPQGMCDWAWADLRPTIHAVWGGELPKTVSCCTDGFRPVFFLIEPVA